METGLSSQKPLLLTQKVPFWILLGTLSVFFTEIPRGTDPYPFFNFNGLLITFPLYTLQILFFGTIVIKNRKVNFQTLFLVGILFGLFDAYITKCIWNPYWHFFDTTYFAGIAIKETSILILWYYNYFAMIIPLMFAEILITNNRKILESAPKAIKEKFEQSNFDRTVISSGIFLGVFRASSASSIEEIILSIIGSAIVITLIRDWTKNQLKDQNI
jgi:hypothetical protein